MESEWAKLMESKWVSTVASIWIQCTSGSLYTFSVYSQTLKSTQSYDQSTLDTLSVFKDVGVNCGLLSGLLYTAFDRPCLVHLAGAVQCFLGYFLIWAAVSGLIPRPPVPAMCLFMLLAAHGHAFFNTANVVTALHNFPLHRGTALGIIKGFLGLSGAILIQAYQAIFNNNPVSFLLMLSMLPTVNSLLLMWFVRIYKVDGREDKKHLNDFSIIALLVAAYLMVIIILEHVITFHMFARVFTFVLLLLLLASPLYVAIKAQQQDCNMTSRPLISDRNTLTHDNRYCYLPSSSDQERDADDDKTLAWRENFNLLQAIPTVNFWILFLAMACGLGSGLATVNNMSQIGGSLGYSSFETDTLVSLWSIWNFVGRFGGGYVSDYYMHRRGWGRPLFMAIALAAMSVGHVAIASGGLYVGSVLVGVCYGSQWSLMPTITSEIFGVEHMGTIFNTITIASPVGSYLFSVRVVGYIYDKEAAAAAAGEGNVCMGSQCFMLSFLIMAFATLLGFLAALGLFFRTRGFYSQVILTRLGLSVRG